MDPSSAPLADYFWIAGVDSLSYGEVVQPKPDLWRKGSNGTPTTAPVTSTIQEDAEPETQPIASPTTVSARSSHVRENSWQRLSTLFDEIQLSIGGLGTGIGTGIGAGSGVGFGAGAGAGAGIGAEVGAGEDTSQIDSNRSSVTIKAFQQNGPSISDFDFDRALRKFASERDSFLDELSFSAGTVPPTRPPMNPKAQKVVHEEKENGGGLKPSIGSIRRRISFRDLNSMKRQPSMARASTLMQIVLYTLVFHSESGSWASTPIMCYVLT
jgi:hypothetical protein